MVGDKILWLGFLTSFLVVILATPSLIKVAKLKHLVDEPGDDRKLHSRSVPTIGGIIIFGAIVFAYSLWFPEKYNHIDNMLSNFKHLIAILVLLFFVGVKDDIIGTAPIKKLVAHMIVGFIMVIMADIRIESMHGIFGLTSLEIWQSYLLSLFVYIVIVNAFNLIDGIDGLAGGIGVIISGFFGLIFLFWGDVPLALLAFVLCGALMGFLVFNFSPARIFMGDSGSLVVGAIICVLAISVINLPQLINGKTLTNVVVPDWLASVNKPVLVMSILVYPLIDTIRVFTIRTFRGTSPFLADRNHIHHRLIALGLNHTKAVLTLYLYNVIVVVSLVLISPQNPTISFFVAISIASGLIAIPFLIKIKKTKLQE
jgi:UDP-N-acetylmuramyl pentapeptide phosphotransferase/UDP-N-acetylglucosamine-1-phosphate transferase